MSEYLPADIQHLTRMERARLHYFRFHEAKAIRLSSAPTVFFHGSRRRLVRPDCCAVKYQAFQIGVLNRLEYLPPNTLFCPATESLKHGIPVAKTIGQVAPGGTRARHPNDGVHKQKVVLRTHSTATFSTRQQMLHLPPLFLRKLVASHHRHPCHSLFAVGNSNVFHLYKLPFCRKMIVHTS